MRLLATSLIALTGIIVAGLAMDSATPRAGQSQISQGSPAHYCDEPFDWPDPWPEVLTYRIQQDSDDGTEIDSIWYPGGYTVCLDCVGRACASSFIGGLRFCVPDLEQGQLVKYARLRLASQGGELTSHASLLIRGADEDSSGTFSQARRPSRLPKTSADILWTIRRPWKSPGAHLGLYYSSPNLTPLVNEILARPNWGASGERAIILMIEDNGSPEGEMNYLQYEDYSTDPAQRDEVILDIYLTLAHAFIGKPILGRPTDTSVTVNVINLLALDIFVEYGTAPGSYAFSTVPLLNQPAAEPIEIGVENLQPDQTYYYRTRYREPGDSLYLVTMEGIFHTQRSPGSAFIFTIQSDSHLWGLTQTDLRLYEQTLHNIDLDNPDFHLALGDFANPEGYADRDVLTSSEALERYLEQRKCLDWILYSIPFYLVLGNHEAEQGWRVADPSDSVAVWAALARKMVVPNPEPDDFYAGDTTTTDCCGRRANYYSWEWGDALFVVLDPFWYTTVKPHSYRGEGSEDPWDWTLGECQYNWLYETLHNSAALWKFVLIHHLTGGVLSPCGLFQTPYGRGGIEAAKYKVDHRGSYEWGGENQWGVDRYAAERPGWAHGPVHDMMVNGGVTILFHGHDHVFVHQTLDGIVYQECPQPSDSDYGDGWYDHGYYSHGTKRNNSGHVRVTVRPDYVQVDYVRSVLTEDEPLLEDGCTVFNRDVSFSYCTGTAFVDDDTTFRSRPHLSQNHPNPFGSSTSLELYLPVESGVSVGVYDVRGRIVRRLVDATLGPGLHRLDWDGEYGQGEPAPQGLYFCRLKTGGHCKVIKMVLLR